MKNKKLLKLLDEARYYHNYSCEEDKALKICNKILKEEPENRDALLVKAGSLSCINKEKEAYNLINKIIKKWPNHWEAYYLMGLLLFNTNEDLAMENFIKSIKLEKNFNNTIAMAQLAYFLHQPNYEKYLEDAKEIDYKRYKNYIANYWEWEELELPY